MADFPETKQRIAARPQFSSLGGTNAKISLKLRAAMERKGSHLTKSNKIIHSITSFALYGFPDRTQSASQFSPMAAPI